MSLTKRRFESQNPNMNHLADKYVCPNCFKDYAICRFITEYATEQQCTYCNTRSTDAIAAPMDDVINFILDGIWTEWDDPRNCVGWEEGWAGADVIDSEDLISELELDDHYEIAQDIAYGIGDQEWCQRDPYGLRTEEALIISWQHFCDAVKHQTRYIFLYEISDDDDDQFPNSDTIPVPKMLGCISEEISNLRSYITTSIDIGTELWRVRIHKPEEEFHTAKDLGTVSQNQAIYSNRMSPAGIPMFYGALDAETALRETINTATDTGKVASVATFKALEKIWVLDLSNLPQVPSLFDVEQRHLRPTLKFMHDFVSDLSKPVSKDGSEHIEYVPTQIFTEYIRHIYSDNESTPILGIIYPSARNQTGKAIVLFLENKHCCDKYESAGSDIKKTAKYLFLEAVERRTL